MQDLMALLFDYASECTPSIWKDPTYQRFNKAYIEIEKEITEKIGVELLEEYQEAYRNVNRLENIAIFSRTIYLGCHFMLDILR